MEGDIKCMPAQCVSQRSNAVLVSQSAISLSASWLQFCMLCLPAWFSATSVILVMENIQASLLVLRFSAGVMPGLSTFKQQGTDGKL